MSTNTQPSGSTQTLARGGVMSVASLIVSAASGFAVTVLIARGVPDTNVAGALFGAIALFAMASQICMLGANTGIVRFLAQADVVRGDQNEARSLVRAAVIPPLLLAGAVAAVAWVFADPIAGVLADDIVRADFADFIRRFAIFLPGATVAGVLLAGTRGYQTMGPTSLLENILQPLLQFVMVGLVIALSLGPAAIATVYWAPTALVFLLAGLALRRRLPSTSEGRIATSWTAFWGFSLPRAVARIFSFLLSRLDVLMIGALATSAQAAVYASMIRFIGLVLALQWALHQPFEPEITRLLKYESKVTSQRQFNVITNWVVLLTWPVLFALMVHGRTLLRVSFGEQYAAGYTPMLILAATMLVATAVGAIDTVLVMSGHSGWSLANLGLSLAANVGLNIVLIPRHGMIGAAIAWSVSILLHNLLPVFQVNRWVGLQPFTRDLLRAAVIGTVSFGVLGVLSRSILGPSILAMLASLTLCTGVFVALTMRDRERLQLAELAAAIRPAN